MEIYPEIELSKKQHDEIEALRNRSFPDYQVARSYYKQLPHMRAVTYKDGQLVGYMGLDYRVVAVGEEIYKVLGVIDFCVDVTYRGQGIGSEMLSQLSVYASDKNVDFIMLISESHEFYAARGYQRRESLSSWLRLHEHKNYGVAVERNDDLYIKPISGKSWAAGLVDWLGYMY
ncbi:GNAT family N-acetyltransferase [Vibrio fluvialis]|uniref:GNAT family N-acetyltransferase n=1 Tax=Vibrio fluvialis TaxID=676 RepID=UPI001C9BC8CF|nr:GNAT family N-acetyltransferase [Vibrio fluvialis]EKO3395403.1 GNAT family N-acetyltransferase [Vibrio fluvialis]MBY7931236.1 GNAT family N-acetyltransferase [Vibrio fluvialis]MBY8098778.1 GNAT family N-acetyltransferase [Vibrio fluvialis]MBY8182730.1 GNAT family N-acetyltransferase [Vibrio fluvialis]MBY8199890.1 GNAT family N-acetyltransferase [Vibrio fluvialis]